MLLGSRRGPFQDNRLPVRSVTRPVCPRVLSERKCPVLPGEAALRRQTDRKAERLSAARLSKNRFVIVRGQRRQGLQVRRAQGSCPTSPGKQHLGVKRPRPTIPAPRTARSKD